MISKCIFVLVASIISMTYAHGHFPVEEHHAPKPYKFGYSIKDKHGEQHREESGTGGHVTGSYGFTDARGVKRQVNYVADKAGFRAQVKTNEPGTANQNPAAILLVSDAPYTGGEGYLGAPAAAAGYGGLGYGGGYGGAYGGLGYGGAYGGLGYGGAYGDLGYGGAYGGLGLGILGGLGYARYGY
ncbi:cuticle protein 10.9-like [Parasteatoda tepidariorum]|uniref:cuticle protein 10.9-like n=1 Tax=Parasteatoda tepidariorum TaxID=114398 RepID=UPI00077FCB2F|nr:probable peroxisomal membrane protein PEX13 [Parasteatoda tepidariorum]